MIGLILTAFLIHENSSDSVEKTKEFDRLVFILVTGLFAFISMAIYLSEKKGFINKKTKVISHYDIILNI